MTERGWIEPIVERVVGQVLDSHVAQLRTEITRKVMEEISAAAPTEVENSADKSTTSSTAADLARAVSEIQLGSSQREILRALLDTSARYAARVALFVVKGNRATGWQARGFANSDGLKDFALDENAPAVARAIGDRVSASYSVSDLDSRFVNDFGSPFGGEGRILPLILKDKVAALVYADGGSDKAGLLDAGSLELLVLATGAWLEVNSLRKQAQTNAEKRSVSAAEASAAPTPAQPAFNDPFASHAPAFATGQAMAAAAAGEGNAPASVSMESAISEVSSAVAELPMVEAQTSVAEAEVIPALADPLPTVQLETVVEPEAAPAATLSPEDQDVHRKAQRFARLLVDEIKLYNQAKVSEGRKNKDLYDRLKEAIEKSRGTYQKRYGNTAAASANYFQNEIIRSLAEDDVSIMGANFRH